MKQIDEWIILYLRINYICLHYTFWKTVYPLWLCFWYWLFFSICHPECCVLLLCLCWVTFPLHTALKGMTMTGCHQLNHTYAVKVFLNYDLRITNCEFAKWVANTDIQYVQYIKGPANPSDPSKPERVRQVSSKSFYNIKEIKEIRYTLSQKRGESN